MSRACAGRGVKERSSGSSILKTSWNCSEVERPSLWTSGFSTSGLFSRGMKRLTRLVVVVVVLLESSFACASLPASLAG